MVFPLHPVLLSLATDIVLRTEETHCSRFAPLVPKCQLLSLQSNKASGGGVLSLGVCQTPVLLFKDVCFVGRSSGVASSVVGEACQWVSISLLVPRHQLRYPSLVH